MPLDRGCSTKAMSKNIKTMVDREGKPQDQAVAIGYSVLRKSCGVTGSDGEGMTPKQIVGAGKAKQGESKVTVQFVSTVLDERQRAKKIKGGMRPSRLKRGSRGFAFGKGKEHRKIKGRVSANIMMLVGVKKAADKYGKKPIQRIMAAIGKAVKKMPSLTIMKNMQVSQLTIDLDKDNLDVTLFMDPRTHWIHDEVMTGNYDGAFDCPQCGGSGGGPDAALRCPHCRGTGKDRFLDDDPRPGLALDSFNYQFNNEIGKAFSDKLKVSDYESDAHKDGDREVWLYGKASDFGITKDVERGMVAGKIEVEFGRELLERDWS
jgi:hypothetical protein